MATRQAPEVIAAALAKAGERDWWKLCSPQLDGGSFPKWAVPSRTTPGEWYLVWRPTQARRGLPWWDALECNCPTATVHSRRICWHKAAVYLRWKHWRTTPTKELLEDAQHTDDPRRTQPEAAAPPGGNGVAPPEVHPRGGNGSAPQWPVGRHRQPDR